jgi:formylglycine-generating enzyme required for sulfatase activity
LSLTGRVKTLAFRRRLSGQEPAANTVADTKKVNAKDGLTYYVWIPPGKFQMRCSAGDTECGDDEKPVHEVTITKGFWLGQTAVTWIRRENALSWLKRFQHGGPGEYRFREVFCYR